MIVALPPKVTFTVCEAAFGAYVTPLTTTFGAVSVYAPVTTSLRFCPVPVSSVFKVLNPSGPVNPSVTDVPLGKPVTVYDSDPISRWNEAFTLSAAFKVTVQVVAPPVHAPDQPPNLEPLVGIAVSVTLEPPVKVALHVAPQLMPVGLLETVPAPVPVLVTLRVWFGTAAVVNVRLTPVNVPLAVT